MIYINNQEKVNKLKLNSNNFFVVADFDRTLTEGASDSTWGVFANANQVGAEYKKRRTELYNKYRPMEIDPNLSEEEKSKAMTEWWQLHINLFYEYGVKEEAVKNAVAAGNLKYRGGAKEFLKKMNEFNVPVIIISAGIGNVIEELKKNAITVGFLDEKIEENLESYNKGFDIVLTNLGSFEDVNNILKIY